MSDVTDAVIARARSRLALDRSGRPVCTDSEAVLLSIVELENVSDASMVMELVTHGFLAGSAARYEEHVLPMLVRLGAQRFAMGTEERDRRHFCGEVPRHIVCLTAYEMSSVPVTNALYALLSPRLDGLSVAQRCLPVVQVNWHDASLFAKWVGARLPTEAEWEWACGAGSATEWCADSERLREHAWFGDNAKSDVHPVGVLNPNALGLHDMHGNVWEWCVDRYDADYYGKSPDMDPVCREMAGAGPRNRVCRGGSIYSLPEMCRTSYRWHEPPAFRAADLGLRLAGVHRHA